MMSQATLPTTKQILLYEAIDKEMKERSSLSDVERNFIVSQFVRDFDFSNTAAQHKSAGSWAKMLLRSLDTVEFDIPVITK